MRLTLVLACALVVGCLGPHSSGALWALRNLDQELESGRQTDTQRAAQAHAYELGLADEALQAERTRIAATLQDCPGVARQPLAVSAGDRVRDAIRLRVGDDVVRQAAVANVALADWRVRRARATAQARFCDDARQALITSASGEPSTSDLLAGLGSATVTRDPRHALVAAESGQSPTLLTVSHYALGYVDAVRAPAPLPQYLAAVYGGVVVGNERPPALNGQTPEGMVDRLAPAYPQWEPDAIYQALRPA
jgi:hypothetical protein